MADTSYKTTWDFSDQHVDSSITKDSFISAARSIIYAAPYNSSETSSFHRVGVVQSYSWGEQRSMEMIYELGSDIPYLIPGRTVGSISLSRILIFGKDLVNLMYYEGNVEDGSTYIKSLKEINKPLDLMFAAYDSSTDKKVYSRVFTGCWIESRSESIAAGQVLVAENASIRYEDVVGISVSS